MKNNTDFHRAAGLMASRLCLVLFHCSTEKCPIDCEWEPAVGQQEQSLETVLCGGRQAGGFVNHTDNNNSAIHKAAGLMIPSRSMI